MRKTITRRGFLRTGAAASLTAAWLGAGGAQQPVKTLRLGFIGVGGRGTYLLTVALGFEGVEVSAICDLDPQRLDQAIALVEKARGKRPAGFSAGPTDYHRLLAREEVDAVIIATPMQLHGVMSVDALRARKHVLSEVAATVTLDECWALVRAAEESGRLYMMSENCCYYRQNLMVRQMVQAGLFGDMTYAECGYVHDCRALAFNPDGSLTWRGELARDLSGNLYPTHALGPVCQWLGIHRGDRLVSLVAATSARKGSLHYVSQNFGGDHPAAKITFAVGDTTTTLIRTAKGAVIDLRYDTHSARPHPSTTYFTLQGETASYKDDGTTQQIWIEGKSQRLRLGTHRELRRRLRASAVEARAGAGDQDRAWRRRLLRRGGVRGGHSDRASVTDRCLRTRRRGVASSRCRRRPSARVGRRKKSRISRGERGKRECEGIQHSVPARPAAGLTVEERNRVLTPTNDLAPLPLSAPALDRGADCPRNPPVACRVAVAFGDGSPGDADTVAHRVQGPVRTAPPCSRRPRWRCWRSHWPQRLAGRASVGRTPVKSSSVAKTGCADASPAPPGASAGGPTIASSWRSPEGRPAVEDYLDSHSSATAWTGRKAPGRDGSRSSPNARRKSPSAPRQPLSSS